MPLANDVSQSSNNQTSASEGNRKAPCQPTETQQPAPEPQPKEQNDASDTEQGIFSDEIPQQVEGTTIKNNKRSSLPMPTELELQIYRLSIGSGKTQKEIAATITAKTGNPCSQSTTSRAIQKVRKFLEAGNVLPDLTPAKGKSVVMDPAKIDMGERQEGKVREDYPPDVDD